MNITSAIANTLQGLETAVAVIDPEKWELIFENAAFFRYFPCSGDENDSLFDRVKGLDQAKLETRMGRGRKYDFNADVRIEPRTLCLKLTFYPPSEEQGYILLEVQNVTKQREAEHMLDSYSKMSEKARRELEREKERVEKLLLNIMPKSVYEEMKDYGTTTPQKFDNASVLMLDFVDFTDMAVARDPGALIAELNDIFSAFDRIVELFDCERIKTIGDAYMAVSGLPEPNEDHAEQLARVALRMKRYLEKRNAAHPTQWRFRIGIASGALIGSIVGIQKYVYDVFGPAVNLAARLEGVCEPMKITVCEATQAEISSSFSFSKLPLVDVKGFGEQQLYTLDFEDKN